MGEIYLGGKQSYKEALENFNKALKIDPRFTPAVINLGNIYRIQKNAQQAIAQFKKAAEINPKNFSPYFNLGMIYQAEKKNKLAIENYEKALSIIPESVPAQNNLAWLYAEQSIKLDDALKLAQKAKTAVPINGGITDTLGWVYYKKGLYKEARNTLEEAIKLSPDEPTIHHHLGLTYYKEKRTADAKKEFQKALSISQNFPEAQEAKKLLDEIK